MLRDFGLAEHLRSEIRDAKSGLVLFRNPEGTKYDINIYKPLGFLGELVGETG